MTNRDKQKVISGIYKFETLSTFIFTITLISCHVENNRVKLSLFERQQGNIRTYGSKLSIISASLSLMWVLGLSTFYLSLALVYGRFTWYFLWPTIILSLMASIYLCQIVVTQKQIQKFSDDMQSERSLIKLYALLSFIVLPVVYFFEEIILSNMLTTLLSGCIWFPQILKNARYGNRNIPKLRHVILLQTTISFLTIYIRLNATNIFKLKPQDNFVVFYLSLIMLQLSLMFI